MDALQVASRWVAGVEAGAYRYRRSMEWVGDGYWRFLLAEQRRRRVRQFAAVCRLVGLQADAPPEIVADRVEEQAFDPRKL